ncbi:(d)CMP kinase [Lichenicoccus roseus]|uniref:Cytidylate kinase n=1 Tax=Lichenicoccus roseus TaxID=2683649 RepID=A0A5R9J8W7_9PROT|nr:(d)CMP kinase [Lichenicoccus roseus]TLU74022.1 (d)CMP kinase [Lichenicoccus roseus]
MQTTSPSASGQQQALRRVVIAVDGPAAAGKGTLAAALAASLGLPYLDTGLLYRAVARRMLDAGLDPADDATEAAAGLTADDLLRRDLRTPEVDRGASRVAAQPGVRAALLAFQRQFGHANGAVLDGRDIGTVIFPDAPVKLFVTASAWRRAERRWLQSGGAPDLDAGQRRQAIARIEAELAARDAADATRATAPLRPAADAILIDTDDLDADAVLARALALVRERLQASG